MRQAPAWAANYSSRYVPVKLCGSRHFTEYAHLFSYLTAAPTPGETAMSPVSTLPASSCSPLLIFDELDSLFILILLDCNRS